MIKRMATAVALSALLASAAFAQSPAPAPSETPAAAAPSTPATAPEAAPAAQPSTETAPAPAAAATASAPAPASLDDCIAAASSLGQMAETKTLPEDKLDKLDELFTKMESLCDAKNFTEAANVAKDIRTMLDGQ